MSADLIVYDSSDDPKLQSIQGQNIGPQLGGWYWLRCSYRKREREDHDERFQPLDPALEWEDLPMEDDDHEWRQVLVCCMKIGSNFVLVETPEINRTSNHWRIHMDNYVRDLRYVPNADAIIRGRIQYHQEEHGRLLGEVQRVTALLGVGPQQLDHRQETGALVVLNQQSDVNGYKNALIKAKNEDLPALFKQIEASQSKMASWMKATAMSTMASCRLDYLNNVTDTPLK